MMNESKRDVLKELEKYLHERFKNADMKSIAREVLQKKEYIDYIVKDVAKNEEEENILYDNYFDIYEKVEKFYKGYFIEEERKMKYEREDAVEAAKTKKQDSILTKLIINKWLDDSNKK